MSEELKRNRGRPARPITSQERAMVEYIKAGLSDKEAAQKAGLRLCSWVYRRRLESAGLLSKREDSRLQGPSLLMGRMWADGDGYSEISRELGVSRQRVHQVIKVLKDKGIVRETKGGKRIFVGE